MGTLYKSIEVEVEVEIDEAVEIISDEMNYAQILEAFSIDENVVAIEMDTGELIEAIAAVEGREVLTRHLMIGEFLTLRIERDGMEDVLQSIPTAIKKHIIREWMETLLKDLG